MTMWTRYCREHAIKDYQKSCRLRAILLRAMHETVK